MCSSYFIANRYRTPESRERRKRLKRLKRLSVFFAEHIRRREKSINIIIYYI